MCLIIFAYKTHPRYKFVLAANRDEFYERPTQSAYFWEDAPDILAGRDLAQGGTWLGVNKNRRSRIFVIRISQKAKFHAAHWSAIFCAGMIRLKNICKRLKAKRKITRDLIC
jgi:uncharacterized protein with NRDE domain